MKTIVKIGVVSALLLTHLIYISESYGSDRTLRMKKATEMGIEDVPYLGAIVITKTDSLHCVASKIHSNVIITAAHCLRRGDNSPLGVERITVTLDSGNGYYSNAQATRVERHPDWMSLADGDDIALVFLDTHFDIPSVALSNRADVDDLDATMYGWGPVDPDQPTIPINPVKRDLVIPTNEVCRETFDNKYILPSMVCAGPDDENISEPGDSGGPLTIIEGDREYLVGIASFVKLSDPLRPYYTAHTRVSDYVAWVEDIVGADLHSGKDVEEIHDLYEGSFETVDYWLQTGNHTAYADATRARSGHGFMWFDGNEGDSAAVAQRTYIRAEDDTLTFWIKIPRWDEGSSFSVLVGDNREMLWEVTDADTLSEWTEVELDIKPYASNDVSVVRFVSRLGQNTSIYLDDVSLAPDPEPVDDPVIEESSEVIAEETPVEEPVVEEPVAAEPAEPVVEEPVDDPVTIIVVAGPAEETPVAEESDDATRKKTEPEPPPTQSDGSGGCFIDSLSP